MFFKKKTSELKIKNDYNLKGKSYIGYCRGHETLILFLKGKTQKAVTTQFWFLKMGKAILKIQNKNAVKVLNVNSVDDLKKYPNLIVKGEIIIGKDYDTNVPEIEIRLENYYPAVIRLWPNDFQLVEISTPQSFSSEADVITF